MILGQVACPGLGAGSAVKGPCGLALAASQPSGQHDTGPGLFLVPAVPRADRCAHSLRPSGHRPPGGRPLPARAIPGSTGLPPPPIMARPRVRELSP